jgi:hypothetical protein
MKKNKDWGWDSELLKNRILKSLGIPTGRFNANKTLTAILAESDEVLDHLPFRISDVVLNTDKIPVIAELLSHPKKSVFWNTIQQSDRLFLFCDPYRPVDNSVVIASTYDWWPNPTSFDGERKTLSTKIKSFNRQLQLPAYACIF